MWLRIRKAYNKIGNMRKLALGLYQSMLKELKLLHMNDEITEKLIESCYLVCSNYWFQLRQIVSSYHFQSEEEEIDFFKNIKPLFSCEIEYYNLLYHAALFRPPDDEEVRKFWERECQRLERFVENHVDFVRYMLEGDTCHDKEYFLRNKLKANCELHVDVEPQENDTYTNCDALVAEFLSLQKYAGYVQTHLDQNR
jgi:hypothetical protein